MSIVLKTPSNGSVTLSEQDTASNVVVTIPATTGNAVISTPDLSYSPYVGFRNRIINGDMRIDQRNAGASVSPTDGQYTIDRWWAGVSQLSKVTIQQNAGSLSSAAATGFANYLGVTSSSAYSVLAGDYFGVSQHIEGLNIFDLAWGTASAKTVTLSAWVYSSLTGTFSGSLRNSDSTRSYPFTYSIAAANTWTQISITIPGDTTGTWLTTNGVGIKVWFSFGTGTTYSSTAGAWTTGNFVAATGTTSVVGTNGATFYITGVQLEKGSTATPFEFRSYGQELALCQRYYFTSSYRSQQYMQWGYGHTNFVPFPTTMRAAPSITLSMSTGSGNLDSVTTGGIFTTGFGLSLGQTTSFSGGVTCNGSYTASSEL